MEMTEEDEIAAQLRESMAVAAPSSSEQYSVKAVERLSRKQPAVRDEYDIVDDTIQNINVKPLRVLRKAKLPIVHARTSKGPVSTKLLRPKVKAAPQGNVTPKSAVMPATNEGGGNQQEETSSQVTPQKRKRGRPRKKTGDSIKPVVEVTSNTVQETEDVVAARTQKALDAFSADLDSPIKPVGAKRVQSSNSRAIQNQSLPPPKPDVRAQSNNRKGKEKITSEPARENFIQEEDHGEKDGEEVTDDEEVVEEEEEEEEDDFVCLNAAGSLIRIQDLKDLRQMVRRVGCSNIKGKWRWKIIEGNEKERRSTPLTRQGRKVGHSIQKLLAVYEQFRNAGSDEERTQCEEATGPIIDSLSEHINAILEERLGPDCGNPMKMLNGIYFNIVPGLLDCIVECAKSYARDGKMNDGQFDEFLDLVSMTCQLADEARSLDRKYQPCNKQYEIAEPTQQVTPKLFALRKKLDREFTRRDEAKQDLIDREKKAAELAKQAEERRQRMAEAERNFREEQERDELERIAARNARWARQNAQLAAIKADSIMGRFVRVEDERGSTRRTASQDPRPSQQQVEDEDDDPFAEEPHVYTAEDRRRNMSSTQEPTNGESSRNVSRPHSKAISRNQVDNQEDDEDDIQEDVNNGIEVDANLDDPEHESVFGKNNVNNPNKPKPFTTEETLLFVQIMEEGYGTPDRYEKAAQALGRSLDEIFDLAKTFQEAMNAAHTAGRLNGKDDHVTFEFWSAPNSEPA